MYLSHFIVTYNSQRITSSKNDIIITKTRIVLVNLWYYSNFYLVFHAVERRLKSEYF